MDPGLHAFCLALEARVLRACLVFTFNFESRALLNILRCRFAFHFGGLYMQGRFFVKLSEESVIDCGDRLQGGIIVRKTI